VATGRLAAAAGRADPRPAAPQAGPPDRPAGFTPAVVIEARLVSQLADLADLVDDPDHRPAVTRDPDDDYLVALAEAARVDALVAGDKDLLDAQPPTVPVLSPRAFLDQLLGG
jgi:hypothetical protein